MPSPNEPLQPTPFDVAEPIPAVEPGPVAQNTNNGAPNWVLPALAGLLLLAAVVIFWLPERVEAPPAQVTSGQSGDSTIPAAGTASNNGSAAKPESTPWSDAQAARLRKEAQDVLEQLLDVQFTLEESGVEHWAPERYTGARAFAIEGDELYKNRNFEQATARYQKGLVALQALQDDLPAALGRQLEQTRQALEQGDAATAKEHLELASLIDPNNTDVNALQQRLQVLPQLLPLLEQATAAEAGGDLIGAETLLQQATALDPQHQRAQQELQRVAAAAREQQFNAAMSEGYAALDNKQFSSARQAFRAAAKLQAGSEEAASALLEVEAAATAHRLAALSRQGLAAEQQEQWQSAVTTYEKSLKIDSSVLFASEGLRRSKSRAQLDKQISTVLAEPLRLSDVAVAEAAEELLARARKVTSRGPVLEKQITTLATTLRQASTPVKISLLSDSATEVIVYKVARLGSFAQHELTLRPGTYTAVGSRNGYRDVRHSFTVRHDSQPAPLTIACTEPI